MRSEDRSGTAELGQRQSVLSLARCDGIHGTRLLLPCILTEAALSASVVTKKADDECSRLCRYSVACGV